MVMYDNELDIKENKCKPRIKLNHNIDITLGRFAPREFTPVSFSGSVFVYMIPPQNVIPARVTPA